MSAAPVAAAPPAREEEGGLMKVMQTVVRMFVLYTAIQFVMRQTGMIASPSSSSPSSSSSSPSSSSAADSSLRPAWHDGTLFDLHVYLSTEADWSADVFYERTHPSQWRAFLDEHLVFVQWNVTLEGERWSDMFAMTSEASSSSSSSSSDSLVPSSSSSSFSSSRSRNITLPTSLLRAMIDRNASIYAHVYFSLSGRPHARALSSLSSSSLALLPLAPSPLPYDRSALFFVTESMIEYKPRRKRDHRVNLLSGQRADGRTLAQVEEEEEEELRALQERQEKSVERQEEKKEFNASNAWIAHWRPTLHVRLVHDFTVYPSSSLLPPETRKDFLGDSHSVSSSALTSSSRRYLLVYLDRFWTLSTHLIVVNASVESLPLFLSYSPIHAWKHRIERTMEESWRVQQNLGTHTEHETDSLKRILVESNPYLLCITFIVSILHSVFDFLAFKNDVQFWRSTKKMGGMSSRSVIIGLVAQVVIFLYLLDSEETSYMILISSGIGLAIEFWKMTKAFDVSVKPEFPFLHIAPQFVAVDERGEAVHEEDQLVLLTQRYDREAMTYLAWALYPMLAIYAAYSLYNSTHKGWYSFVISSLVSAVYLFGFLQMTPQLYINYKLKSVAHMPWKMLTYKFFGTIIDDLFAFVITMPTLHRLATFRDDVIFVIFLYQRYIYSVDDKRLNEFGISGLQIKEAEARKAAGLPPLTAASEEAKSNARAIAPAAPAPATREDDQQQQNKPESLSQNVQESESKESSISTASAASTLRNRTHAASTASSIIK